MKLFSVTRNVFLTLGLAVAFMPTGRAQRCGFDAIKAKIDPEKLRAAEAQVTQTVRALRAGTYNSASNKTQTEYNYEVPVVVHVVHNDGEENISDAQVQSQITVLNEAYTNLPAMANGNKLNVQFFLAKCDPDGNPTTGIVRVKSPYTVHGPGDGGSTEMQLKGLSYWDSKRYYNIWTVRSLNGSILGYTQYVASLSNDSLDGVVVAAKHFGNTGYVASPYDLGKTTVHETGHYFGIYHTFDNGCMGSSTFNCLDEGDLVCDTPQSDKPNYGCPNAQNTCIEFPDDKPDMTNNFMDYTDDRCMDAFTGGQEERMLATIQNYRGQMVSENNVRLAKCLPISVDKTDLSSSVRLSPNPFQDRLLLCGVNGPGTFTLFDVNGRNVYHTTFSREETSFFDVETLPQGVYSARIETKDGFLFKKVVK